MLEQLLLHLGKRKEIKSEIMKEGNEFNMYKFRECVEMARDIINGKDENSLASTSLLAELIYDYDKIEAIDFSALTWQMILDDYSEWKNHYNITEYGFSTIKNVLLRKFTI